MGVKENVACVLHEDGAVEVWGGWSVDGWHCGEEGLVPEKQMIFRLVGFAWVLGEVMLGFGTERTFFSENLGGEIVAGIVII